MDLFSFSPLVLFSFLLTLMRVSLVVFLLPFYGGDTLPAMVKVFICLVLTMALWPHLSFPGEILPAHPGGIALILLGELILGLMLGLCVAFIFAGIQTGGEIMGFQMGFTMVTLADPFSGAQVSISSHLLYMVALMIFLTLDGHLVLLRGLADSFALVPPGGLRVGGNLTGSVLELSAAMFSVAVQIAGPILAALFLVELALALMGRAAPQMNLLTLGFPLKIAVGFFFIGMIFSLVALRMEDTILEMGPLFNNLMRRGS
ncbi:MAG: flagellar biosynthetic protein FliR [Desulfovibrio sp.]|jgi:flagellar biosynthetic protein FliR|nr:flagellar biosynthetic protein FliR [Desulfovibrio sp.]